MVQKREAYAPWSLTRKAGVQSATVNGDIEVPQFVQPVIDTGFVDEKGNWKGLKSSDEQFNNFGLDEAIAELGEVAEGVNTLALVKAKADELKVNMPLVDGLYALVYQGADASTVAQSLMARDQNSDVEFVLKRS